MPEREPDNDFQIHKKEFPKTTYYIAKNQEGFCFYLQLGHVDSFSLGWLTDISTDDFLRQASHLSDKVAQLRPSYRPTDTENPISVASVIANKTEVAGTISVPSSYSGYNYNNIMISTAEGYNELKFSETGWPLNRETIEDTVSRTTGQKYELRDGSFIRVNTEFCTLVFNGEPGLFTYWSHVPAIDAVTETFSQTSNRPESTENFRDTLNVLTSLNFSQHLPEK